MNLNPGIALGAALIGGSVGGFIGAFFALPTVAAIQAFLSTYATRYEVVESKLTRVDEEVSGAARSRGVTQPRSRH